MAASDDPDARARLLAAASRLFKRQGYSSTGVKQLLETSDTVAGSLYHHFPGGKQEVAVAVVNRSGQEIGDLLTATLQKLGTLGALDQFVSWLALSMDASGGLEGCPIAPIAIESPNAGEPVRRAAAAQFAAWTEAIAARLRAEGHPDSRPLAEVLLSAIEGALLLSRTSGDTAPLDSLRLALPRLLGARSGEGDGGAQVCARPVRGDLERGGVGGGDLAGDGQAQA